MTFDLVATGFHGIPWNIPWNSMEPRCHFKWGPPSSMEFHKNWWHFSSRRLSSMESHRIFHGTCDIWTGATLVPWNSMEPLLYSIWWLLSSMDCYMKLQGYPVKPGVIQINNRKVSYNSMRLCYSWFGGGRVPWNSIWYSMEFHETLVSF